MAFQPNVNAFRLSGEEATGQPSYLDAIMRGFQGSQSAAETVYKPRNLAEALLHSKLSNKVLQETIPYIGRLKDAQLRGFDDAHLRTRMETDPEFKADYINRLVRAISGIGDQPVQTTDSVENGAPGAQNLPSGNTPFSADNTGYNVSGEGPGIADPNDISSTFPGRKRASTAPTSTQKPGFSGAPDLRSAVQRAVFKQAFGVDPYALTPDQKIQMETEKERQKKLSDLDIKQLGDTEQLVQAGIQATPIIEEMGGLITNPVFQSVRQLPIAPGSELAAYKRIGTPEQRNIIGQAETAFNQFITDSIKMWGSRMTDKDLSFMQRMKISENDSLDAIEGKYEMLKLMHDVQLKRSKIASGLMRDYRLPMQKAYEFADKQIDAPKIRKEINEKLNAGKYEKMTEKNGKKYGLKKGKWYEL